MSSNTCPTVRVVNATAPGGFVVINESDLTKEHEIWTGEANPPPYDDDHGKINYEPIKRKASKSIV